MNDHQIARQTREEHRKLDQEIELLTLRLCPRSEVSLKTWFAHCTEHFRHFHTQLRRHMELEEYGGFLKAVRERRPTLAREVEVLRDQHRDMLKVCTAIEEFLEDCRVPTAADEARVRSDIEQLLASLEAHEQQENRLVQQVFVQDIGSGD